MVNMQSIVRSDVRGGPEKLRRMAWVTVGCLVVFALPFILENYWLYLVGVTAIYAIAGLGLVTLFGFTGQLSLAHASFFGIGAYVSAIGGVHYGLPGIVTLPIAFAICLAAGAFVGIFALRISGLRFALITLSFGELFYWASVRWSDLTGGEQGLYAESLSVMGIDFGDPINAYFLFAALGLLATALCFRLRDSSFGRAMAATRDSELAAKSSGVPVARTRYIAFIIGALFSGVAGWLFSGHVGAISPNFFDMFASLNMLVAVIIGGVKTPLGAWVGAAYLVFVPEFFGMAGASNLYPILSGALLVLIILVVPAGVVPTLGQALRQLGATRGDKQ